MKKNWGNCVAKTIVAFDNRQHKVELTKSKCKCRGVYSQENRKQTCPFISTLFPAAALNALPIFYILRQKGAVHHWQ